jgi:DNA-binding transcriptional MerR regulator
MRNAGLSIESLIEYLALFRSGEETVPARMDLLVEQQRELQERIDVMKQAMDRLTFKIENYTSHMVPSENKLREFK